MTKKTTRKVNTNKTTNKKNTSKSPKTKQAHPPYITIDGCVYERLSPGTVDLELDLDDTVLSGLDDLIKNGKYVSRGDAIRDILRNILREKGIE